MESKEQTIKNKLQQILDKLLLPNVSESVNLSLLKKLIIFLSDEFDKETGFHNLEFGKSWLRNFLDRLKSEELKCPQVISFGIQFLALTCRNEEDFVALQETNLVDGVFEFFKSFPDRISLSLQLINLLNATISHNEGFNWIAKSGIWEYCLDFERETTFHCLQRSAQLIYSLMCHFDEQNNADKCLEVAQKMMEPLRNSIWINRDHPYFQKVNDPKTTQTIKNLLILHSEFFKCIIDSKKRTSVAYWLLIRQQSQNVTWTAFDVSVEFEFNLEMLRLQSLANIVRLALMKIPPEDTTTQPLQFDKFSMNFYNFIYILSLRNMPMLAVKFVELTSVVWHQLGDMVPAQALLKDQHIKFADQLIIIQLMPIATVLQRFKGGEYLDRICSRLFDISCEFTIRYLYGLRDLLLKTNHDAVDMACKAIHGIVLAENLNRERAVLTFQALFGILDEFGESVDLVANTPNLLSAILTGIFALVKNHQLGWKDSLETSHLVTSLHILIKNRGLSTKLAVQTINLMRLSIEQFLSPHMALLVENLDGSGLENLGGIIYPLMMSAEWEIRDSALELVISIVQISKTKFPAFQRHLTDSKICETVISQAKHDPDSYVRCSALKCLHTMLRVRHLWATKFSSMNLMDYLLSLLESETEGIVRSEAVLTITSLYSFHVVQEELIERLYSVMALSAVKDLHWETKVNSLAFWRQLKAQYFHDQGMIDGTFPPSIFLDRKIIQLTPEEIQRRLGKAVAKFAATGGLGVILAALCDEGDLEVVRTAIEVVNSLKRRLTKYSYFEKRLARQRSLPVPKDTKMVPRSPLLKRFERTALRAMDNVIDSILELDDLNLLDIRAKEGGWEAKIPIRNDLYKEFAKVTEEEFFEAISKLDLDHFYATRLEWLTQTDTLESLLDDMLASSNQNEEVNCMDCTC